MSQTDRQTNSLTLYTGVRGFFHQGKFASSLLLTSLAGGYFWELHSVAKYYVYQNTRAEHSPLNTIYTKHGYVQNVTD